MVSAFQNLVNGVAAIALMIARGFLGRREGLVVSQALVSLLVHPLANTVADREDDRFAAHSVAGLRRRRAERATVDVVLERLASAVFASYFH
jgi:hypothetical protein